VKLLRRILALLIVAAYVGAATIAPMAYADSSDMSGSTMHQQHDPGSTMPCKGMSQGCYTELGCVFLVSMPTPHITLFTATDWSSVTYSQASDALRGRTIEPALGPPISQA